MRNLKYYLMLGIVAMLASCSQNEEALQVGNNEAEARVTFRLTANDGPQTRATVEGLARYCIEVYAKGDTAAAPIYKVYDNTNGQFDVYLRENQTPATILFWADYGDTYYDVSAGLKQISMKDAVAAATSDDKSEAFFHKLTGFELPTDESIVNTSISLKRAIGKVVLTETIGLEAGKTLTATFDHFPQFNVATETTAGTAMSRTLSFPLNKAIDANTEVGSFTAFAPTAEKTVAAFTFGYDGQTRQLSNVPLQANFQTKITGKFDPRVNQQFNITTDDSWNTPDHIGSWLKVGDDYTHTVNGQEYACKVISAEYTKAVVAYTTRLPNAADDRKTYAETQAECEGLGGRLPSLDEFKVLVANGIVPNIPGTDTYYALSDRLNCARINLKGEVETVYVGSHTLYYNVLFDLTNPNL